MKKIVRERIVHLLKLAEKEKDKSLKKRYVELAFKLSVRNRVRIPREWKRRFCRKCFAFWGVGNLRVRVRKRPERGIEYKCLECGKRYFFPVRRKRGREPGGQS